MVFIKLFFNILRNNLGTLKKQSRLKVGFVFFCSSLFLLAEYTVCYKAFLFIRDFPGVGSIISERLMYLFYFSLFFMMVFSNAIISYATIYRSKDTELLFTMPVSPVNIFQYKFLESVMLSSWAFFLILIPFMLSFGMANSAHLSMYFFIVLFFIPFLLIAASLGSFITMALLKVMPGRRLKGLIIFIGVVVLCLIYIVAKKVRMEQTGQTFEIFMLNKILPNIRASYSPLLPSYWVSEGLLRLSRAGFKEGIFWFFVILSSSLFFVEMLTRCAMRIYKEAWIDMRSLVRDKVYLVNRGIIESLRPILSLFGQDISGLITKDMKLFFRDTSQWSQFLVFFGILGVYFLNIRNFSYNMLEQFWKNVSAFLNLTATLLTLGSLSTRFIFPQISMEGNKFWIIGLAPIGLRKILYQKFWTSSLVTLAITEALIIMSNRMLGVSDIMMYSSVWVVFIMNFALIGLSLGLGASFPDFKSENPARIVSGFGGTLTLMVSIVFILMVVILCMLPFQLFLKGHITSLEEFKKAVFFIMVIISIIGALLCGASLIYGEKRLRRAEF